MNYGLGLSDTARARLDGACSLCLEGAREWTGNRLAPRSARVGTDALAGSCTKKSEAHKQYGTGRCKEIGTDIHAAIEYLNDNKWTALEVPNPYFGKYDDEKKMTARVRRDAAREAKN